MIVLLLYILISPLIWISVWLVALLFPKGRSRITVERSVFLQAKSKVAKEQGTKDLLVFHAASAGEFEQLKPLLAKIDRNRFYVLQTFYSFTIYTKEKDSELFDVCCFHPLDSGISAWAFFRHFKPKAYIVCRHDLWPSHLYVAQKMGISSFLVNANLHTKSLRSLPGIRGLNRWMFHSFSAITCGSERLKESILHLAPQTKVYKVGETRFERVIERAIHNPYNHFNYSVDDRKNVVLGSIIPSDYAIVLTGYAQFTAATLLKKQYRAIVVAHEVDQRSIDKLTAVLDDLSLTWGLFGDRGAETKDVLVVNTVGILAELYGYGYCAYVGAGFGAGVHSVIEPAAYGIPVFFGPNIHILDEAIEMAENGSGTVITSAKEVEQFLESLENSDHYGVISTATKAYVESMAQGSSEILTLIEQELDSPKEIKVS